MSKYLLIVVVFLFGVNISFAQKKSIIYPTYKEGDSTYSFKNQQFIIKMYNLDDLSLDTNKFRFRFWTTEQIIDIWTNDNINFQGQIITFAQQTYKFDSIQSVQNLHVIKNIKFSKIESIKANEVNELFNKIASIPVHESFRGWERGLGGVVYKFEVSDPKTYIIKEYNTKAKEENIKVEKKDGADYAVLLGSERRWLPSSGGNKPNEEQLVLDFVKNISITLELYKILNEFYENLTPGMYTTDGNYLRYRLIDEHAKQMKCKWF